MRTAVICVGILFTVATKSYGQQTSNYKFSDKTIALDGQWNLVMNEFLSVGEIAAVDNAIPANAQDTWNDLLWEGSPIGAYGYGTFYTTVTFEKLVKSEKFSLEVSEIGMSYRVYANGKLIGQRGSPGRNKEEEVAKLNYGIYDFEVQPQDTLHIIFHVSNFSHESGGLWYAPNLGFRKKVWSKHDFNKAINLIIIGAFLIGALFQLYLFIMRRRKEKVGLYFFFGTLALVLLIATRGEMVLLDFFPGTHWMVLKKTLYISLFLIAPMNGRFMYELFPAYINKKVIDVILGVALSVSAFTLVVHPSISYVIVPYYHVLNVVVSTYLLILVGIAAIKGEAGARFLLVGYIAAFSAALHDILVTQYLIEGFSFALIHIGTIIYIIQLLIVLGGRYVFLLDEKERLSTHLKTVNQDLEKKVAQRTEDLSQKNKLIELKNTELEKTLKEKEYLMEVVAHDLKAPFNTIMGISDILKKELEGRTAEFNEMIKKLTLDGRRIVEEMTEVKAFEEGKVELNIDEIPIIRFFNDKLITFSNLAVKKNIHLEGKIAMPKPTFRTDETILTRIIDNLLSNAIKFSPKESRILFELHGSEKEITLMIQDEGPGFSKEDKKKIFQKFQRLSAKPTGGESSTGLGLSIVKALVKLLKGKIELSSDLGKGARFVVKIPSS